MKRHVIFWGGTLFDVRSFAADTAHAAAFTPPSVLGPGSLFQVIFSLALVLVLVMLAAWLMKRAQIPKQGQGPQLKLISSLAVGQRERVVVVEFQDTWIVLGVAPGRVNAVQTLHRQKKEEHAS